MGGDVDRHADAPRIGSRLQRQSQVPRDVGVETLEAEPLLLKGDAGEVLFDIHDGSRGRISRVI